MRILCFGIITIGLRAGMGAVSYALGRPVYDAYLHALRFALIAIAVIVSASSGLLWGWASVSVVEGVCSVVGQMAACRMLEVSFGRVLRELIPGFTTAVGCAAVTVAGRVLATNMAIDSLPELLLMVALPAAAFLLIEARTVRAMLATACGSVTIEDRLANPSPTNGKTQKTA